MSEQEELLKELFQLVEMGENDLAIDFLNKNFKKSSVDFELIEDYLYSSNTLAVSFILDNFKILADKKSLHLEYLKSQVSKSKNPLIKEVYNKAALSVR